MSKEQQTTTVECGLEGASHHSTDEIRGQSVVANGEAGKQFREDRAAFYAKARKWTDAYAA